MKPILDEEKIEEALTRGVSTIYPSKEALKKELSGDKPLRIYFGADPTGEHLHIGHLTNLLTLKRLQKLGHEIIFLIGDFTAMIGDPTDKMAPRQPLTEGEVKKNMLTFKKQVLPIISFSGGNPAKIRRNSKWYKKMKFKFFMDHLLGSFSVQNLLHRKGLKERIEKDQLRLQEFIYPLLQGYDGVELKVNVEIGGNDQTFNMNIGRALRKAKINDGKENFFIATTLLVNPKTGNKLMNKSEGGMVNLDDTPEDVFGKTMAIDDAAILAVAEFCTEMPIKRVAELKKKITEGGNPRDAKLEIAEEVVKTIYGASAAKKAGEQWEKTFSKRETPDDAPVLKIPAGKISAVDVVVQSGVVKSKSEAGRLIAQGGFEVNEKKITDPRAALALKTGDVLKIGKRHFFRIK